MIITGGILYIKKIVVSSNWYGKASTVIFYAGVLTMIMWKEIPDIAAMSIIIVMIVAMFMAALFYIIDIVKNYEIKRI